MKGLAVLVAFVAATLAFVAFVVFGLGDRGTFVSPPEVVVEDVLRALQCRRFTQAPKHWTAASRARVSPSLLAEATARLESRIGRIEDVGGEAGWVTGDDAEAFAVLRTDRSKDVRLQARLRRESGEWRVTAIESLAP